MVNHACLPRRPVAGVAGVRVTGWGAGEGQTRGMALADCTGERRAGPESNPRGRNAVT